MPVMLTCLLNREGFFFKKDNFGCSEATSNQSDTSSDDAVDVNTIEQTEASTSQVVPTIHSEQSEPNNRGSDRFGISGGQICSQETTCEYLDGQNTTTHVETKEWESSSCTRFELRDGTRQNVGMMSTEDTVNDLTENSLQIAVMDHSDMLELIEVHTEQSQLGDIAGDESNLSNHNNLVEGNIVDDADLIESVATEREQQEVIGEIEESDLHQTNVEWRDSTQESVDDNHHSSTSNEWPQNILENEDGENSRLQEQEASEVWQEDGDFQEAVEIWLGGPSDNEVAPVGRIHGFYFPEDDNVYSVELRELLSRYADINGEFRKISFLKWNEK